MPNDSEPTTNEDSKLGFGGRTFQDQEKQGGDF
jgi:hypothetical protein